MNLGGEQDPRESRRDKTKRMGEYRFKGKGQKNRKVKNLLGRGGVGGGKQKAIQKVNSKEENKTILCPKDK